MATSEALERIQEQVGGQVVDQVVGTFYKEKVYLEAYSAKVDKPIHGHYTWCRVRVPGNVNADHVELVQKELPKVETDDGVVLREKDLITVTDGPIKRFPLAWDAFLRGEDLRPEGTPIEECEDIPKERIAALKASHIKTVEELSALPDRSLQRIGMDARALQRAAQKWLEANDEQAKMAEEFKAMKEKVAELEAANGDSKDDTPKRSGRSRNNST